MRSKWEVGFLLTNGPSEVCIPWHRRDVWSHLRDFGEKSVTPRNRKCGLGKHLHHMINSWQLWEYLIVLETEKNGNGWREIKGGSKRGSPLDNTQLGVRNNTLLGYKNKRSIEVNKIGTYSSLQIQWGENYLSPAGADVRTGRWPSVWQGVFCKE